jgi:integrase
MAGRKIVATAFDTGMRKREVLDLRWNQVDLRRGVIKLAPQDTKGGEHRLIPMTARVKAAIEGNPRRLGSEYVFANPKTTTAYRDIDRMFHQAVAKAELDGLWFHDLRRSFITNARKKGVPESVVMRLSGHRTREVFDRYNIVSEDDLWRAVAIIERPFGHDLDKHRPATQ